MRCQREGGGQQGHMKEKMKSDLVDPGIWGRKGGQEGRQNESAATARGRKLIPPRCCASVGRGYRASPLAQRTACTPPRLATLASVWNFLKRLCEWWKVGGLQMADEARHKTYTCTHINVHNGR